MTSGGELERTEVEAALETRRELGMQYDAELVDGFADRIEAEVERRVSAETTLRQGQHAAHASAGPRQLALGIVSLMAAIPITAITLAVPEGAASMISMTVAWSGIGVVNLAHALQSRQRRGPDARGG